MMQTKVWRPKQINQNLNKISLEFFFFQGQVNFIISKKIPPPIVTNKEDHAIKKTKIMEKESTTNIKPPSFVESKHD